jgi:poly[(R)-3-hydroxyalkanoate] polymerase subunit PhaC
MTPSEKCDNPYDVILHAAEARITDGLSPASAALAWFDWAMHLANSPGKQADIAREAMQINADLMSYLLALSAGRDTEPPITPLPNDHRFNNPGWQKLPYAALAQTFLSEERMWNAATTAVRGVSHHHLDVVKFGARQWLDMMAPPNFLPTNPEIMAKTVSSGGANLVAGAHNFTEDWIRAIKKLPPPGAENFRVGKEVAVTPGKVVFRNELIELIQYTPTTEKVIPEPVLIVPAWIMKYYILDLSPHNSMVKYLVEQGHTVFMISWKNPGEAECEFGMDTYIHEGVLAALEAVRTIVPGPKIHAVGYCIGGTLLSLSAALLGRKDKDWLKTISLFAAQTDFTEAGEIMTFVDESQVTFLEDLMAERGYLDAKEMVGAFQMLRSNDLVWSRVIHDYLMGERQPMFDLMAWNADATRMPYRMHSEYLHDLFLHNDFAGGRYRVDGIPVALRDIRPPIFQVGAEKDHVAPWHSVYKVRLLADTEVTFLLTSGGHNAGIISEPGHPHRHFRVSTIAPDNDYLAPDEWFEMTPVQDGSWWPEWRKWLATHSGEPVMPPPMGNLKVGLKLLEDAPGSYVLET